MRSFLQMILIAGACGARRGFRNIPRMLTFSPCRSSRPECAMNKLVFATVIALPLAASFPALAQQGARRRNQRIPAQVRRCRDHAQRGSVRRCSRRSTTRIRCRRGGQRFRRAHQRGLEQVPEQGGTAADRPDDQQTLALVGPSGQAQQPATAPAAPDQAPGGSTKAISRAVPTHDNSARPTIGSFASAPGSRIRAPTSSAARASRERGAESRFAAALRQPESDLRT